MSGSLLKNYLGFNIQVSLLSLLLLTVLGVGTSFAMACAFVRHPTIFKYPAMLCSMFTLGTKLVAVFVHTPEVKEFSLKTSTAECNHESSIQLLLLLHIWLRGGELYHTAIISSILVIGKVGSENILMKGEVNKLEEKSFIEKVLLILQYTPVMALTSMFRLCGSTIAFHHPSFLLPLSPTLALFLTWAYLALNVPLLLVLFTLLKPWSSSLRKLTPLDLASGIMGEFVTVSLLIACISMISVIPGDRLGRSGSRGKQRNPAGHRHLPPYHFMQVSYLLKIETNDKTREIVARDWSKKVFSDYSRYSTTGNLYFKTNLTIFFATPTPPTPLFSF